MIDPHVHLRDWAQSSADTIAHALRIAKKCGFTHVFDMPNTSPYTVTSREVLKERLKTAENSKVDGIEYHTYFGLTGKENQAFRAVNIYNEFFPKVIGLKLFLGPSTGGLEVRGDQVLDEIFSVLSEKDYKGVLAVHCEDSSLFEPEVYDNTDFSTHSYARPAISEYTSVENIIKRAVSFNFKGTLHIAHVSCAESIKIIKKARNEYKDLKLTFGVTPHHALLNVEDAKNHDRFLKVNPPLRSQSDMEAVFNSLIDGSADWIESDHAPHTIFEKSFRNASGLPGFAGYLFLIKKLREQGVDKKRIEDLICKNAAKVFGIKINEKDVQVPRSYVTISREVQDEYKIPVYELGVPEV